MPIINIAFVACSLLAQPGIKQPCKEVTIPVMTQSQAYGVVAQPQLNGAPAGYAANAEPEQQAPLNGATVYAEGETPHAKSCFKNGEFEIAKWAIAHPHYVPSKGFTCSAAGHFAKA
jgi:hypothetical protein